MTHAALPSSLMVVPMLLVVHVVLGCDEPDGLDSVSLKAEAKRVELDHVGANYTSQEDGNT